MYFRIFDLYSQLFLAFIIQLTTQIWHHQVDLTVSCLPLYYSACVQENQQAWLLILQISGRSQSDLRPQSPLQLYFTYQYYEKVEYVNEIKNYQVYQGSESLSVSFGKLYHLFVIQFSADFSIEYTSFLFSQLLSFELQGLYTKNVILFEILITQHMHFYRLPLLSLFYLIFHRLLEKLDIFLQFKVLLIYTFLPLFPVQIIFDPFEQVLFLNYVILERHVVEKMRVQGGKRDIIIFGEMIGLGMVILLLEYGLLLNETIVTLVFCKGLNFCLMSLITAMLSLTVNLLEEFYMLYSICKQYSITQSHQKKTLFQYQIQPLYPQIKCLFQKKRPFLLLKSLIKVSQAHLQVIIISKTSYTMYKRPSDVGMNLPVGSHIERLGQMVQEMKNDSESLRRQLQILRGSITQLSYINKQSDIQLNGFLIASIGQLRKTWNGQWDVSQQELKDYKKKIAKLQEEHEDIEIIRQELEQKISDMEQVVGLKA